MKTALITALFAALSLTACDQSAKPASVTDARGNTVTEWPLPALAGAAQPDLSLAPDGRLLLSWVKPFDARRHALQFTTFDQQGQWLWAPKTIAVGGSMFVNWADTPHIAATADGSLWAHWLQRTRSATSLDAAPSSDGSDGDGDGDGDEHSGHDATSYDIFVATSKDGGMRWSASLRPHNDGQAVEHGFVSFWPAARDRIGIAWLDGRRDLAAADAGAGMTSLHAATIDTAPRVHDATQIDATACDCCNTDVAMTTRGPLLVYRDRTADEIRDIHATRLDGETWRTPAAVHADGWKMTACPVNGPAVAAQADNAVVAWYTAANDKPMLKIARSSDAGDTFAAPVTVDSGEAVQDRTDVALDANQAWVAWLREDASGQSLWVARYTPDLGRELARIEVAKLKGRGRGTGFPKLVARDGEAFLVWTDIAGGSTFLRGARVSSR